MVEGAGSDSNGSYAAAKEFGATFQAWLKQYQHDQELIHSNINALTRDVGELTATVRSLVDNQKGLFTKANRPLQWGAIGTGFGLLIMMASLLVAPMLKESDQQGEFDRYTMLHLVDDAAQMGRLMERSEWLKELEKRHWEEEHTEDLRHE